MVSYFQPFFLHNLFNKYSKNIPTILKEHDPSTLQRSQGHKLETDVIR